MARQPLVPGPASQAVAWNVQRRRAELRITAADLVERLGWYGRTVHRSWVSEVETGRRRVDVDDLIQLAAALGVSPPSLLMPQAVLPSDVVPTPLDGADEDARTAGDYWQFLVGERAASSSSEDLDSIENRAAAARFLAETRPRWVNG